MEFKECREGKECLFELAILVVLRSGRSYRILSGLGIGAPLVLVELLLLFLSPLLLLLEIGERVFLLLPYELAGVYSALERRKVILRIPLAGVEVGRDHNVARRPVSVSPLKGDGEIVSVE